MDFQVIGEVQSNHVKLDNESGTVSLEKKSFTQMSKLFSNAVDTVMEKLGDDGDSDSEESDESAEKVSVKAPEDDMQVEEKKTAPAAKAGRKILRAKKPAGAAA